MFILEPTQTRSLLYAQYVTRPLHKMVNLKFMLKDGTMLIEKTNVISVTWHSTREQAENPTCTDNTTIRIPQH